jgi:hypothetical protein
MEIHMGAILNILMMMLMMMMLMMLVVVVVEATQMVMTDDIQYEIGIDLLPRKSDTYSMGGGVTARSKSDTIMYVCAYSVSCWVGHH